MAATVVSLPLPPSSDDATLVRVDNPAEARKRRREILAAQRSTMSTPDSSSSNVMLVDGETTPETKRRKVITSNNNACDLPMVVSPPTPARELLVCKGSNNTCSTTTTGKKPQMKYDPDVPMTREAAAAWRREQRRKRNRESAAASRQRQRDRIMELEAEVDEWKARFEEAMRKIHELEQQQSKSESPDMSVEASNDDGYSSPVEEAVPEELNLEEHITFQSPEELVEEVFKGTTIFISPTNSPRSVSPTSSTINFSQGRTITVVSRIGSASISSKEEQVVEEAEPSNMISRPAESRIIHNPPVVRDQVFLQKCCVA